MLLPVDPLITVHFRDIRVTVRTSTLLVVCLVCGGAVAGLHEGASARSSVWLFGTVISILIVGLALLAQTIAGIWACRRLGIAADRVHFLSFGGVISTRDETSSPRGEALVGAIGLAPLAILTGLSIAIVLTIGESRETLRDITLGITVGLAGLAILQVLPGLGLGGGRVLRALVWYLTDNPLTGARASAIYAYALSAGLTVGGVALLSLDGPRPYWGLWAIVAGWQLSGTARFDVHRIRWRQLARETLLSDVIVPHIPISANVLIDAAIEPLLTSGNDAPLIVNDAEGRIVGILRFENLRAARRSEWSQRTVAEIMTPPNKFPSLPDNAPVRDALDLLDDRNASAIVINASGDLAHPIAVLSRRQLMGRLHDRGRP